jgi:hypothetical protein
MAGLSGFLRGGRWRRRRHENLLGGQQGHQVADRPRLADLAAGDDDLAAVETGLGILDLEDLAAA